MSISLKDAVHEQAKSDVDALIATTRQEMVPITHELEIGLVALDDSVQDIFQAYEMADIVGVLSGVKPAALLGEDNIGTGRFSEELPRALQLMGLTAQKISSNAVAVSRHPEIVHELSCYYDRRFGDNTEAAHYGIGKCLGYPVSATEYFLRRLPTLFGDDELPIVRPLSGGDERYFHQFVLSPGHYQEEIDTYAKPLREAVELMAPNTYRTILEHNKHKVGRAAVKGQASFAPLALSSRS